MLRSQRLSTRIVPSHSSSSFESSGEEETHTTSQSASEGRTKEEERAALSCTRHSAGGVRTARTRPSLFDWLACVVRRLETRTTVTRNNPAQHVIEIALYKLYLTVVQ
ncbi:hypothetical protein Ddc_16452 [Ditylenchus destructor]|nr:hypothetical protein Ddc_16452 [Ditylenchus destructor]